MKKLFFLLFFILPSFAGAGVHVMQGDNAALGFVSMTSATIANVTPALVINVKDYGAKGDNAADDTTAIQNAVNAMVNGSSLYFPRGIYLVTNQINIVGFVGIKVLGDGRNTTIKWNAPTDTAKAIIYWKWTSHSEMAYLTLHGNLANAGYGLWVTSNGTGGTNTTGNNHFHDLYITRTAVAGIQLGSLTNIDVNIDENSFSKVSIFFGGQAGMRIWNSNTNNTTVRDSGISDNTASGIDLGLNARGSYFENLQMSNNGTAHFYVRKEQSSTISIRNFVIELDAGSHPFLVAEVTSAGVVGTGIIEMDNLYITYGAANTSRIIDYQQSGIVSMKNCIIAGPTTGPPLTGNTAELYFSPASAVNPGLNALYTEGIQLYGGAHFNVRTTGTSPMRWFNSGYGYSDSVNGNTSQPDASFINVKLNSQLVSFPTVTGVASGSIGSIRRQTATVIISTAALTAAATNQSFAILTVSSHTRVVGVVSDVTTAYAGLAGTIQLNVGSSQDAFDFILAHDIKTAATTKGLVAGDLGTGLAAATAVQGGAMGSWIGNSQIWVTFVSGTGNFGNGSTSNLSAGSTKLYITTEVIE